MHAHAGPQNPQFGRKPLKTNHSCSCCERPESWTVAPAGPAIGAIKSCAAVLRNRTWFLTATRFKRARHSRRNGDVLRDEETDDRNCAGAQDAVAIVRVPHAGP